MSRSLDAPLSPNEEVTLRRVALGISPMKDLAPRDLTRLTALSLVEIDAGIARLTEVGRQRYRSLPRAGSTNDVSSYESMIAAVGERLRKTAGKTPD
jgi:hypothetical protein